MIDPLARPTGSAVITPQRSVIRSPSQRIRLELRVFPREVLMGTSRPEDQNNWTKTTSLRSASPSVVQPRCQRRRNSDSQSRIPQRTDTDTGMGLGLGKAKAKAKVIRMNMDMVYLQAARSRSHRTSCSLDPVWRVRPRQLGRQRRSRPRG
jgi:hypothetical protein